MVRNFFFFTTSHTFMFTSTKCYSFLRKPENPGVKDNLKHTKSRQEEYTTHFLCHTIIFTIVTILLIVVTTALNLLECYRSHQGEAKMTVYQI